MDRRRPLVAAAYETCVRSNLRDALDSGSLRRNQIHRSESVLITPTVGLCCMLCAVADDAFTGLSEQ